MCVCYTGEKNFREMCDTHFRLYNENEYNLAPQNKVMTQMFSTIQKNPLTTSKKGENINTFHSPGSAN